MGKVKGQAAAAPEGEEPGCVCVCVCPRTSSLRLLNSSGEAHGSCSFTATTSGVRPNNDLVHHKNVMIFTHSRHTLANAA